MNKTQSSAAPCAAFVFAVVDGHIVDGRAQRGGVETNTAVVPITCQRGRWHSRISQHEDYQSCEIGDYWWVWQNPGIIA
jgi:hypothetical protein